MTNKEKIEKIKSIYDNFLVELNKFKKDANKEIQDHIENIDKEEINKILDKINKQY